MTVQSDLVMHLRQCRQRANYVAALGLAALLAWWTLPDSGHQKDPLARAFASQKALFEASRELDQLGARSMQWVKTDVHESIERAASEISSAGSELQRLEIPSHSTNFFTTSERIDPLLNAASHLGEHPLSADFGQWSRTQVEYLARLLAFGREPRSNAEAADLRLVRAELTTALSDLRGANVARRGLASLNGYEEGLKSLETNPPPENAAMAARLKQLSDQMEAMGVEKLHTLELMGEARRVTSALKGGSLSVLGFSVPGLVIRLLVPLLALGVALEFLLRASRARAFADFAVPPDDTRTILNGLIWSPVRLLGSGSITRSSRTLLGAAPFILSFGVIVPLCLTGDMPTAVFGLLALMLATAAAVRGCRRLAKAEDGDAASDFDGDAASDFDGDAKLRMDLAKVHLDTVDNSASLLTFACVTVLSFFLAFLLVPAALLKASEAVKPLQATRNSFDQAYKQRLLEQSEFFVKWCEDVGCDPWTDFAFAQNDLPSGHPALPILVALQRHAISGAESSATSTVKDLVTESRAALADLDREDVAEVREILYRNDFSPIVDLLGQLQRINAKTPLTAEALSRLPQGIAQQPVSGGPSVPFAAPYRVMVERGGFADRLAPLPTEEQTELWLRFMTRNGLDRVKGFDLMASELAVLEDEIGKTTLKIGGINVSRELAAEVALFALLLLTFALAVRLRQARFRLLALPQAEARMAIASRAGALLVYTRDKVDIEKLIILSFFAVPVVTAATVLSAKAEIVLSPLLSGAVLLLIAAAALLSIVERERLIQVMTRRPAVGDLHS